MNQRNHHMKIKLILPILFVLALFGACKSTTTVVGNSDTGTLKGNVALVNALGDTLPNYAGATIQIQGTSFQATSNTTGARGKLITCPPAFTMF